jgi:hypothetical protein
MPCSGSVGGKSVIESPGRNNIGPNQGPSFPPHRRFQAIMAIWSECRSGRSGLAPSAAHAVKIWSFIIQGYGTLDPFGWLDASPYRAVGDQTEQMNDVARVHALGSSGTAHFLINRSRN